MSYLEEEKREYALAKSVDLSAKLQEISVAQFEVESLPKQRQVSLNAGSDRPHRPSVPASVGER